MEVQACDIPEIPYVFGRELQLSPVLYNYALCYGAAHRSDSSSEASAWPFISLGLGDKRMRV